MINKLRQNRSYRSFIGLRYLFVVRGMESCPEGALAMQRIQFDLNDLTRLESARELHRMGPD